MYSSSDSEKTFPSKITAAISWAFWIALALALTYIILYAVAHEDARSAVFFVVISAILGYWNKRLSTVFSIIIGLIMLGGLLFSIGATIWAMLPE